VTENHRSGIAALVGRANVGKSTLLNQLLGMKLSIVSPRPQTTRNRIMGVVTEPDWQVAFVDTPGLWRGGEQQPLQRRMSREAEDALVDVDLAVVLVDPGREADPTRNRMLLEVLEGTKLPAVLALNKIDLLRRREELLPVIEAYAGCGRFDVIVPICARSGENVDRLTDEIRARLPEGEALFPAEMLTDVSERFLCAEIIREKVFRLTGQEVPYATAVEIERFDEAERERIVRIFARVVVEREGQQRIVIGKGGAKIKEIGSSARRDIERLLGTQVFLDLRVSQARDWSRKPGAVERLGHFADRDEEGGR
jgi:GTP-binding protein Era